MLFVIKSARTRHTLKPASMFTYASPETDQALREKNTAQWKVVF
jgi:hypothetical protein